MSVGILLVNIGTPDAPTAKAVREYLKEFLSDPRVVEIPKILWQPFLHCVILPTRAKTSANLYKKIWTDNGSPLLYYSLEIAKNLQRELSSKHKKEIIVRLGMRYGQPSIKSALEDLRSHKVERILIFPMYPQYSGTTTASSFDGVAKTFKNWRHLPETRMLTEYASDRDYIKAISSSIQSHWENNSKKYLLFSYHGIPKRFVEKGDSYENLCHKTTKLIVDELNLKNNEWTISFQSRLGKAQWLKPYTDVILKELPNKNIKQIQVVCPGFPVDCLETLEEIAIRGKEQFLNAGGEKFEYIPALNNSDIHIYALTEIISKMMQGW